MLHGSVSEIFPTVQGEGLFTGEKQVFLRLAGCPFRCDYCDTPHSLSAQGHPRYSALAASAEVRRLCWQHNICSVSITGGEPLAQAEYLEELLPLIKADGFAVHLETAGIHYGELEKVIKWCDVVAMDIKLPSAIKSSYWFEHKKFIEIGGPKVFTKVVIESHTLESEIGQAIDLLAQFSKPPTLIFQIVTPVNGVIQPPDPHEINNYVQMAKEKLPSVMVLTQKHKEWAIR